MSGYFHVPSTVSFPAHAESEARVIARYVGLFSCPPTEEETTEVTPVVEETVLVIARYVGLFSCPYLFNWGF